MEYNGISTGFLFEIPDPSGTNPIIVPNVHASYGPFSSLAEAKADLTSTFESISNVPRGYTFCVIENNKPQEYWFTKKGDWASIEKKNTSSESAVVSTIIFRSNGGYIQVSYDNGDSWNNLVSLESLKGPAGINGTDGKDGKQGPKGEQGPAGTVNTEELVRQVANNFGMQIVRNTYTDDEEVVHYEYKVQYRFFDTWITATGSIRDLGSGGGGSVPIIRIVTGDDGNKYWEIDGAIVVDEDNHPVRANGIDGENGADGRDGRDGEDAEAEYTKFKSIAFIRSNATPSTPPNTDGTYEDPVPRASGWSDGIPATDAYGNAQAKLWMTTRWFSKDPAFMEISSYWSAPQPATDTADIDLEYSNAPLDTSLDVLGNPTGNPYSVSNPNGWYDASEVSAAFLSQANWQAIRTKKNGVWGAWSIYKIKGENGESGISPAAMFKTHVYMRSNAKMATTDPQYDASRANDDRLPSSLWPVGGSYDSPIPINTDGLGNLIWYDGIPAGKEMIWESVGVVVSDSETPPEWSEPAPVSDTQFMDFEWCDADPLPSGFKKPSRTSFNDDDSGRLPGDPWYDDPNDVENPNPVWKAERPVRNGEYVPGSDWFVYRVRGENGTQGTSIVIQGHLFGVYGPSSTYLEDAEEDYLANHADYGKAKYAIFGDPNDWTEIYEFSIVDGEVVATDITSQMEEGYTYIFNSDGYVWDGDNFFNAGRLQGPEGPSGESQYIHIKYSDDSKVLTDPANARFSGADGRGEIPGEYIGTCVDTNPDDDNYRPDMYTWKKWNGEDGWGYEYIFILTDKDSVDANGTPIPPSVPTEYSADKTSDFQKDDHVPTDWTDNPQSPYKEKPYCWVAFRQKIDGLWTRYKGSASNNALAALFSMYSSKGRGLAGITEKYAVWDNPINGPTVDSEVWQDSIPEFDPSAGYIYLWNYEIVSYDDGTDVPTTPACIGFWQEGISIQRIEEFYYASSVESVTGLPGYHAVTTNSNNEFGFSPQGYPAGSWNRDPSTQRLSKDKIYLWNYEVVTFRKGNQELPIEQKYFVSKPAQIAYYTYTDVEYLLKIFENVEGNSDTAYLGGLLGVVEKEDGNDVLRAMLNATDLGQDGEVADGGKGKLIIASGFHGREDVNNATFKVYENGHVEMNDATLKDIDIQGFMRQYFYRQHDSWEVNSPMNDNIKSVNAVQLGWEGLTFVEDGRTISYGVNRVATELLYSLPPGRFLMTNQIYTLKDGTTYVNNKFASTILTGRFMFLNGGSFVYFSNNLVLKSGWVELLHIVCKDKDYNTISPDNSVGDKFIILGMGGTIECVSGESEIDIASSNGTLIGGGTATLQPSTIYKPGSRLEVSSTNITDNIIRVHPSNRYISINTLNNEDTYVILGKWAYNNGNSFGSESYCFRVTNSGRLIFKVEAIGDNTPNESVPALTDVDFLNKELTDNNIVVTNTSGYPYGGLFRITRLGNGYAFIIENFPRYH